MGLGLGGLDVGLGLDNKLKSHFRIFVLFLRIYSLVGDVLISLVIRSQVTCNLRDTGEAASLAATPGTERTTLSWSHAEYLFRSAVTDSTKVMVTR